MVNFSDRYLRHDLFIVHLLVGLSNHRKGGPTYVVSGQIDNVISAWCQALYGGKAEKTGWHSNQFLFIRADKGDLLMASYFHHVDHLKSAGVAEISRRFSTNENTFTVGAAYAIDPLTAMKMRLNNYGKLGALLQHELMPKSTLTISGEFDTKAFDNNPRFGLALALKP